MSSAHKSCSLSSCLPFIGGEAFFRDLVDQFRSSFRHDLSARKDVDCVHFEGGEDRRVVGYDQERGGFVRLECFNSLGNGAHRVHIEAGIGLVQNGQRGLKQQKLQDLRLLFLTSDSGSPMRSG